MNRLTLALATLVCACAPHAHGQAADPVAGFAWMAGSWIEEKGGVTSREVWLTPMGGVMAGAGQTNAPGRKPFVEHFKITVEPAGPTFTAILPGQPPTPFVLLPGKTDELVFENKAHDFPQRIMFRRCGEDRCARIEGLMNGKLEFEEWRYRRLPPTPAQ